MALRALIVDDEELARERLRELLTTCSTKVQIVGEAESGQEGVPLIHQNEPDVVFLDVQMPVLNGFDVVEMLAQPRPHIVFVTAFDEYALRAFEVHALDYLTKPVRHKRLEATLEQVLKHSKDSQQSGLEGLRQERSKYPLKRLAVRAGQRVRIVSLDNLVYMKSENRLVFAHTTEGKYWTDHSLKELEERLAGSFLRTHRSYLVNAESIRALEPRTSSSYEIVLVTGERLPVARRRTQDVLSALGG